MSLHNFEQGGYLLSYTREPMEDILYAARLAGSMHLAFSFDGERYEPLNHNSGVLFALATQREDGTLNAKSLKKPYIFTFADGTYGVVAIRTEADGEDDSQSKGSILLFSSKDLLSYQEVGLIAIKQDAFVSDVTCEYDAITKQYHIRWSDETGAWYENRAEHLLDANTITAPNPIASVKLPTPTTDIEGIQPRNIIKLPKDIARRLVLKLTVPTNIEIQTPLSMNANSPEELRAIHATAIYSDGTQAKKQVEWDSSQVDWEKNGTYSITGTIVQPHFNFPVALNRADPCITQWKGSYYFIATNDADHNKTLFIRKADTIAGLVEAEEKLILDTNTYDAIKGLLWAPEFHEIEGELYIFHAATTGEFFYEECHVMKLRKGGDPTVATDWSEPTKVLRKDGTELCEAGKVISLDMTVIRQGNRYYASWSERQFVPVDLGAWVYIAEIDPSEPWKLISDPVLLTRPDYGWANNHTFVDEGPFALYKDDKIFLTFASAAVDATYVVGLLTIDKNADLLDRSNWTKGNYPLLTSRSVPGEFGPGHNSYVTDENGDVWNAYHARPGVGGPRSTGIRRVHFDIDGYPVLDLTEEKDLDSKLAQVTLDVIVNCH